MRNLSARKGREARARRTYTKRKVECECNTPEISGRERKAWPRDKMLDCDVVSTGNVYVGVQPNCRKACLPYWMGPIMTLQAARNRTLPIVHLKVVSAQALQTGHISTEPV